MIDPHWDVVDCDPVTWRNLGRFIDVAQYVRAAQPGEHGLFIVHDQGRVLKIFDTDRRARSGVKIDRVVDARALAKELYARGQWDRVHVINQQHLARVGLSGGRVGQSLAAARRLLSTRLRFDLGRRRRLRGRTAQTRSLESLDDEPARAVCQPPAASRRRSRWACLRASG